MNVEDLLFEQEKKKYPYGKRFLSLIIDAILVIGTFAISFFSLGEMIIKEFSKNDIEIINDIYKTECSNYDLICVEEFSGIMQLDRDTSINKFMEDGLDYNRAIEKYNDIYYEIDTNIQNYDGYNKAYDNYSRTYYIVFLSALFVSTFIFLLVIPLLGKKKKTIGMMWSKLILVDDDSSAISNNIKVFLRFFSVFAIELSLSYAILSLIGWALIAFINIVIICLSKKHKTIHDYLVKSHLEFDI